MTFIVVWLYNDIAARTNWQVLFACLHPLTSTVYTVLNIPNKCTSLQFQEDQFTLRDPASHDRYCQLVAGPSGSFYSKEYGINSLSVLNELTYFNVCSGGLLPDIMHDVLEGALQYEVKLMLKAFIFEDHYFTLDQLNTKLETMELGYMDAKDRPTPITVTHLRSSDSYLLSQSGKLRLLVTKRATVSIYTIQ